jgi:putative transposase
MSSTFCCVRLHIVFSTKNRTPLISARLQPLLYEYLGGITRGMNGSLLAAGGTADHVHLLASWRTDKDIAALVRELKSESSKWIHQTHSLRRFNWQKGYGVFSVSHSDTEQVRSYLQRQAQHHAKRDFKQEFLRLLELHEVEFDERYVFD